jgi:hypothetical protein
MRSICHWVSRGVVILITFAVVTCLWKKLVNTGMVPSKLKRHFTTNHCYLLQKTTDYFKRPLESQVQQCKVFEKKVNVSEKAQEASYLVAQLVAQKKESHVIAESSIMPACKIIVNTLLGKEALCEVEKVHYLTTPSADLYMTCQRILKIMYLKRLKTQISVFS